MKQPLTDQEKIRGFKILTVAAIAVIVVLGVLVAYDNYKLSKAQFAYSDGWNQCAAQCNAKLDFLNSRCNIVAQDVQKDIPVVIPDSNSTDNVIIQLTS